MGLLASAPRCLPAQVKRDEAEKQAERHNREMADRRREAEIRQEAAKQERLRLAREIEHQKELLRLTKEQKKETQA